MPDAPTIATIVSLATLGYTIAKDIAAKYQSNDRVHRKAVRAFYKASTETKKYLNQLPKRGQQEEKEMKLAELWQDAAYKLSELNIDLSDRLYLKAHSWLNPEQWPPERVEEAQIGFDQIQEELLKIQRRH